MLIMFHALKNRRIFFSTIKPSQLGNGFVDEVVFVVEAVYIGKCSESSVSAPGCAVAKRC